jgi:hypothetical protein
MHWFHVCVFCCLICSHNSEFRVLNAQRPQQLRAEVLQQQTTKQNTAFIVGKYMPSLSTRYICIELDKVTACVLPVSNEGECASAQLHYTYI